MFTRLAPRLTSRASSHLIPEKPAIGTRILSSEAMIQKNEFRCIIPDKPDILGLRKQAKGAYYEGIKTLIAAGELVDGGAILETHSTETDDAKIKGSMVVYTAENEEEVRGIIEKDVYATSGVWDLEKVQIWPC
ncbi:hypothetical protein CA14_002052 [Aspergillus flavus]|uniref:YCII-related domain-containing protein n=1 Tax=Aspergillus flavus TaxID=5059 RepID=A0AB74CKJ8_ASPFL|nr:hypothetical protein NYO67_8439 [Aspergillus flavus]RMZ47139.1 hypothetical protein CA14_002052 [Aspergillus flavus]